MQIVDLIIESALCEVEQSLKNKNHTNTEKTGLLIKNLASKVEALETERDEWRKCAEKWQTKKQ
mgnify:CR=1 FL=1